MTALPQDVPARMKELLEDYHGKPGLTIEDLARLHAAFETIHPFQDGNGRVGRMILFKECLTNGLVPVIIRNDNKAAYIRYLNDAQVENKYDGLVQYFQEEQAYYVE